MKHNFYPVLYTIRNFIDDSNHDLETELFDSIIKRLHFSYNKYSIDNLEHLPINAKNLNFDYKIFPRLLESYYTRNHLFEKKSFSTKPKFNNSLDHLIVAIQTELNDPLKSQTQLFIAEHLSKILQNDSDKTKYRIILILPTLPPAGTDLYEKNLKPFCDSNQLVIVDWKGKSLNASINFEKDFQHYIQKSNLLAPKKRIDQKLIRKVGHFMRPTKNGHSLYRCHRYFYDGSECVGDLMEYFCNLIKRNGYETIIFYCPESIWLQEAIEFTKNSLMNEQITISNINLEIPSDAKKLKTNKKKCLLVFDLIDTGETYSVKIQELKAINSKLNYDTVSILITDNDANKKSRSNISEFILEVKQRSYENTKVCPLCKLGIEHDSKNSEAFHQLSTYNFWELAREAGFEEEREYPKYLRDPLKCVPVFSSMLVKNKAYLAYKSQLLLSHKEFKSLKNYIYISPDETGAKAYAKSLNSLYGIYTIVIPRNDLEVLNEMSTIDRKELDKKFVAKDWYIEIQNRNEQYIIFDEFTVSGGTFKDITKLLNALDKKVVAYLPLIKFTEKEEINDIPLLSLYSFDLFITKPKSRVKQNSKNGKSIPKKGGLKSKSSNSKKFYKRKLPSPK